MRKLVVSRQGQFQSDAKGLDRHDGDGSDGRTYRQVVQGIRLAIFGGNLIDHDHGKDGDDDAEYQESCISNISIRNRKEHGHPVQTDLAARHSPRSDPPSECPHPAAHEAR